MAKKLSHREQAEETLIKSNIGFRTLFEQTNDAVFLLDLDGRHIIANQRAANLLGYTIDEIQTLSLKDISAEIPESENILQRLLDGEKISIYERAFHRKDGSLVPVEINAELVTDINNHPFYIQSVVRDITKRKQAEAALRRSEALLAEAQIINKVGHFEWTAERNELTCSDELFDIFNLPRHSQPISIQMLGKYVHLEDRQKLHELDQMALAGQSDLDYEYRLLLPENRIRWIRQRTKITYDENGTPIRSMGVCQDITEQKQAAQALFESEQRYRTLADAAHDTIFLLNKQGVVEYVNEFAARSIGYEAKDIIGKRQSSFFPSEIAEHQQKNVQQVFMSGQPGYFEGQTVLLGRPTWLGSWLTPIKDTTGEVVSVLGISRDITERKQAIEKLEESEASYRALAKNLPGIVYRLNLKQRKNMQFFNTMVETMTGYKKEELVKGNVCSIDPLIMDEDRQKVLQTVKRALEDHRPFKIEYRIRRKDAEIRFFVERGRIILGPDNDPLYIDGVILDITESKQAEEAARTYSERLEMEVAERTRDLQNAQGQLMRQEKLAIMGQLAGGVAHELRNPLSVINNVLYMLRLIQTETDPKIADYIGIIAQEIHNAEKIINDLLEFSRTKFVDREVVSVKEVLEIVLERFPAPETVTVEFLLPADLPPVFADPRHLQQIFGNLITNACQAMVDGGILTLSAAKKDREVAISVGDTGIGITPENMAKLFEPLFTTKAKGIGLGLAVSQKLVNANGGRLEVHSELGIGSTFTVFLPTSN